MAKKNVRKPAIKTAQTKDGRKVTKTTMQLQAGDKVTIEGQTLTIERVANENVYFVELDSLGERQIATRVGLIVGIIDGAVKFVPTSPRKYTRKKVPLI